MCFVYASFDLHRVMKLDILYCFLFSLDILVHDFEHVFLQLIQLMPKHIIYSTVCLVSGDLKLVIALYLYHGVNASDFQQFIGCSSLFLFLTAANLSLYCVVSYGSQRLGYVHSAFRMWVSSLLPFQPVCLRFS